MPMVNIISHMSVRNKDKLNTYSVESSFNVDMQEQLDLVNDMQEQLDLVNGGQV